MKTRGDEREKKISRFPFSGNCVNSQLLNRTLVPKKSNLWLFEIYLAFVLSCFISVKYTKIFFKTIRSITQALRCIICDFQLFVRTAETNPLENLSTATKNVDSTIRRRDNYLMEISPGKRTKINGRAIVGVMVANSNVSLELSGLLNTDA